MSSHTGSDWRPGASLEVIRLRARMLSSLRAFFAERGVLEVDTPVLSVAAVTDPHIESFSTAWHGPGLAAGTPLYLHTSPEFPMKRLLAAGSGPIYQVCKVFRDGEAGRHHNPEFTLLEWYRPGFDHHRLMDEVETLLRELLGGIAGGERLSYRDAFLRHAGIDPMDAEVAELRDCARSHGLDIPPGMPMDDPDPWRDLLLTQVVEPHLGHSAPCFLYDYPASQAALARVRDDRPPVAERFEVYYCGLELANGFHELADAREQRRRFERERAVRRARGLEDRPMDERLLAALEAGLPDCAGVALGLDRLLMIAARAEHIGDVLAFPFPRA